MHTEHKKILGEIEKGEKRGVSNHWNGEKYMGTSHHYYNLSTPVKRQIIKDWVKAHKDLTSAQFVALLNSLYEGKSHEEKTMASLLLGYLPKLRKGVKTADLDRWLGHLIGWSEVDSLCQNVFTYSELLGSWKDWQGFIVKLSKDKNINKRRASLVFLTGPVVYSDDNRLKDLAFEMIEVLKHEKPILITKAISWLLRSMVTQHKNEVATYIEENKDSLPKIAIRETTKKIKTGRK